MFNQISASIIDEIVRYPIIDSSLSFADYINQTRNIVEARRLDLQQLDKQESIIHANVPFELYPKLPIKNGDRCKYGALLIHGLLDSPFTFHDIGLQLQQQGILSRSILLPGHGTHPTDLLHISYNDWINTVHYGIESLKNNVENIFLVGYSTGATLSIYHALHDKNIAGIILLSPCIRIRTPIDAILTWQRFRRWFNKNNSDWICVEDEIDYAKYQSIPFNGVLQVSNLIAVVDDLIQKRELNTSMLMVVSREDETISSRSAIEFFNHVQNTKNQLLLYTALPKEHSDKRIVSRKTFDTESSINHFSHIAIPFAPTNKHYGKQGDFVYASVENKTNHSYGAYNSIEQRCWDFVHRLGLIKNKRWTLTYNPDFEFMMDKIFEFIFKH